MFYDKLVSEPLDILEGWTMELFSKVKAGPLLDMTPKTDMPFWKSGKLYKLEAVRDVHSLYLSWTLPCLHKEYMKKPEDYLAHLLGHGKWLSTHSLSSLLFNEVNIAWCLNAKHVIYLQYTYCLMFAIPSNPSPWSLKLLTGKAYTPWSSQVFHKIVAIIFPGFG